MDFWGLELKGGSPVKVQPADNEVIHLSQATLAELKNCTNPVMLYAKVGDQKLVIGVLKADTIPQISTDLVFEKEFELSHNWKNGVVHFTGYKSLMSNDEEIFSDEDVVPVEDKQNDVAAVSLATKAKPSAPVAADKKADKAEDESDDSDESDESDDDKDSSDESDSDGEKADGVKSDDSESESDSDSEGSDSEDETPVKPAGGKKRPASDTKTPEPKKAKLITPQKSGGKKAGPVHVDTPHPSKNTGKGDKSNVKTTPKSLGQVTCGTCNRSFNSKNALDSHSKAKHST